MRGTRWVVVTTERLPRSRVALSIEVEAERLEASMERAVRRLSEKIRIPGFRPGKAPRQIVEQTVGHGALLQEALDQLLPDVYQEALESESIEPVDQPEIELTSTEPLVVQATVPVRPSIDLRDYHTLRIPRPEARAAEPLVEETVEGLRRRYATLEPVDRAIGWSDTVRCDVHVAVEGQDEPHLEEDAEFSVRPGGSISLPGFLDGLIGLERGGPHEFTIELPADYEAEELAGKSAAYTVTIHEVKEEVLPDLDDGFAHSLDEGFDSVEALQSRITEQVTERLVEEANSAYRDEILDLLVAHAELDYPEVLVDREVDRLIDQQSNHASHTREGLDQWLAAVGQTEQEVRDALRDPADHAVRRSLVLGELVSVEGLAVEPATVDAEVEQMIASAVGPAEANVGPDVDLAQRAQLRTLVESEENRASIQNQLLTRVALDWLVEMAEQPAEEGAAASRPRPRRRTGRRRRASGTAEATGEAGEAGEADDGAAEADAVEADAAVEEAEGTAG
jgi:trigger factor